MIWNEFMWLTIRDLEKRGNNFGFQKMLNTASLNLAFTAGIYVTVLGNYSLTDRRGPKLTNIIL
jgi:hypothetical protein